MANFTVYASSQSGSKTVSPWKIKAVNPQNLTQFFYSIEGVGLDFELSQVLWEKPRIGLLY